MLRKLLLGFGILVVLAVVAIVALPFIVPADVVRDRIQAEVERQTGQTLRIAGDLEVRLFPRLTVRMGDVTLAGAGGAETQSQPPLMTLESLDVRLALGPLFSGRVEVTSVVLNGADIVLSVDEQGRPNWGVGSQVDQAAGDAPIPPSGDRPAGGRAIEVLSFDNVIISNGRFLYRDDRNGRIMQAEAINLAVTAPGADRPVGVNGSAVVNGEDVTIALIAGSLRALTGPGQLALDVSLDSTLLSLDFSGTVERGAPPVIVGALDLDIPSVDALGDWLDRVGLILPIAGERIALAGSIEFDGQGASAESVIIETPFVAGTATIHADWSDGNRPSITGDVALSNLDVDALRAFAARLPVLRLAPAIDDPTAHDPAVHDPAVADGGVLAGFLDQSIVSLMADFPDTSLTVSMDRLRVQGQDMASLAFDLESSSGNSASVILHSIAALGGTAAGSLSVSAADGNPVTDLVLDVDDVDLAAVRLLHGGPLTDPLRDGRLSGGVTLSSMSDTIGGFLASAGRGVQGSVSAAIDGGVIVIGATDAPLRIEGLNMSVDWPDTRGPLRASAAAAVRGEAVDVSAILTSPFALLDSGRSALGLTASLPAGRAEFDGAIEMPPGAIPSFDGALLASSENVPVLLAFLDVGAADAVPFQSASYNGNVFAAPPGLIRLEEASIQVDDLTADGTLALDLARVIPSISGQIALSPIDLDRFVGPETDSPASTGAGWSADPIDLSALRAATIDIIADLQGITWRGLDIGPARMALDLTGGVLDFAVTDAPLEGGLIGLRVSANAAEGVLPRYTVEATVTDVQARPVLNTVAGVDALSGATTASFSLTASGQSQQAIVSSLSGSGLFLLSDGEIRGINIAAMLRNVRSAFGMVEQGGGTGSEQSTDFAQFGASLSVNGGVAATDDLMILAPLFRLDGAGRTDIAARTLAFRLMPRLVATFEGQGGDAGAPGLMVPVIVGGTWDNPTFRPDLDGMIRSAIQDPDAARATLQNLISGAEGVTEGIGGSRPEDAIRGLLEGLTGDLMPPTAAQPSPESGPESSPESGPGPALQPGLAPSDQPGDQIEDLLLDQLDAPVRDVLRGLFGN